jgi:hypothetical protein
MKILISNVLSMLFDKQHGGSSLNLQQSWDELLGHMRSPQHLGARGHPRPPDVGTPQEGLAMERYTVYH